MSKKRLSDEVITKVLKSLFEDQNGVTVTAEKVLGRRSRESTVRRIKKIYEKHGNYFGITLDGKVNTEEDWKVPENTLETLCEHPDWNVSNLAKRLRTAQRTNNQLRKVQREIFDGKTKDPLNDLQSVLEELKSGLELPAAQKKSVSEDSKRCTIEILFSDWQTGKVSEFYNTETSIKALYYWAEEVLKIVEQEKPEKLLFASLGDIIEDHLKHGVQSAISTDTGLAEQMANAIEHIWKAILLPLIETGIPMEVVGIQGNHGSSEHKGMDMYKAGRYGYDYTIYKALETLTNTVGADWVDFRLPEGCFYVYEIYGQKYLAEHGYTNGITEKQMEDHKRTRQENIKEYIHGYRQGDKHHTVQYDNSNLVVNGAFFGIERQGAEYSGIKGFNSIPCQLVFKHEPVEKGKQGVSTISQVYNIQVAKGY